MSNNYNNNENIEYYDALEQRYINIKKWNDEPNQENDFFLTFSQSGTLIPIYNRC